MSTIMENSKSFPQQQQQQQQQQTATTMTCENKNYHEEDSSSSPVVLLIPPPASWLEEHFQTTSNMMMNGCFDHNYLENNNDHNSTTTTNDIRKEDSPCYKKNKTSTTTTTCTTNRVEGWDHTTVETTTIQVKTKRQILKNTTPSSTTTNNHNNNIQHTRNQYSCKKTMKSYDTDDPSFITIDTSNDSSEKTTTLHPQQQHEQDKFDSEIIVSGKETKTLSSSSSFNTDIQDGEDDHLISPPQEEVKNNVDHDATVVLTPATSIDPSSTCSLTTKQQQQQQQPALTSISSSSNDVSSCWSRENLPIAAKELITSTFRRALHHTHLTYYSSSSLSTRFFGSKHTLQNTDLGNNSGGYYRDALLQSIDSTNNDKNQNIQYWEGIQHLRREDQQQQVQHGEDEWDRLRLRLPPFSSLPWVDRQLVKEWRTSEIINNTKTNNNNNNNNIDYSKNATTATTTMTTRYNNNNTNNNNNNNNLSSDDCEKDTSESLLLEEEVEEDDEDYVRARTMVPKPSVRPPWENASSCYACRNFFNPTLLRHHCRLCGRSYCQSHSSWIHKLPHLGYNPDVPERVCRECKSILEAQNLAERIAWRMARCRDYLLAYYYNNDNNNESSSSKESFTPYFETGVDTVEEAALRITRAAIHMARSIPLGAQATVAVETLEVLRKHGLKGLYGLVLRKEFMAAADLLCKVTGINKRSWPLSVHELSAAIFYALSQHRAMRGMDPDREHRIHHYKFHHPKDNNYNTNQLQQEIKSDSSQDQQHCNKNEKKVLNEYNNSIEVDESLDQSTIPLMQPVTNQFNYEIDNDDDDGGGDTVVWGDDFTRTPQNCKKSSSTTFTAVIDETDSYNPMAQSVVNLLALAKEDSNKLNSYKKISSSHDFVDDQNHEDSIFYNSKQEEESNNPSSPFQPKQYDSKQQQTNNDVTRQHDYHQRGDLVKQEEEETKLNFVPVCDPVPSSTLSSLIFYAPVALNFIYQKSEVDMQLLAAQQGWRLLYAHLHQDAAASGKGGEMTDKPASALFVHDEQQIACFAIRGTASINDVITDIRALPIQFPDPENTNDSNKNDNKMEQEEEEDDDDDWTPIFRGQGLALCGMARAAVNLFRENIDAIVFLACKGYRIRLTGHSLGGGVAALLGTLIRRHLDCLKKKNNHDSTIGENNSSSTTDDKTNVSHMKSYNKMKESRKKINMLPLPEDVLRVYSYGSPACVDAKLSDYSQSYVTNCVLHDDVVPRLTPTSIRALLKHLLHIRETWVKAHLANDLMAITIRAQKAWAPRWRSGFTLMSNSSFKKDNKKKKKKLWSTKKNSIVHRVTSSHDNKSQKNKKTLATSTTKKDNILSTHNIECSNDDNEDNHEVKDTCNKLETKESGQNDISHTQNESKIQDDSDGQDDDEVSIPGVIFDGDCFFEAEESLLESDDEDEKSTTKFPNRKNIEENSSTSFDDDWVPFDEPPLNADDDLKLNMNTSCEKSKCSSSRINEDTTTGKNNIYAKNNSRSSPAVMLEETPLPRMFIPGKIVHIYTYRGGYNAAYVPRAFRELRRISLAANMLHDHMSKSYYEALLECKTIRNAKEQLPVWTSFADETTCSCCASRFTWASTSDSEAQEARDKHNCRSCGSLVCAPCSENKIPLPSMGITTPVRICDRCYHDMGCVTNKRDDNEYLTRSFISEIDEGKENREDDLSLDQNLRGQKEVNSKPYVKKHQCSRQKRSHVVDELASRLNQFV